MEILDPTLFHPVGTVGIYENIHVKVMPSEDSACIACAFNQLDCLGFKCSKYSRRDRIGIVFKRIE